ncbi:MAG: FeoC-like transcriptional regulator [Candidatus Kariarchaeaceae archaeon]|jgi:hypothetical protein
MSTSPTKFSGVKPNLLYQVAAMLKRERVVSAQSIALKLGVSTKVVRELLDIIRFQGLMKDYVMDSKESSGACTSCVKSVGCPTSISKINTDTFIQSLH